MRNCPSLFSSFRSSFRFFSFMICCNFLIAVTFLLSFNNFLFAEEINVDSFINEIGVGELSKGSVVADIDVGEQVIETDDCVLRFETGSTFIEYNFLASYEDEPDLFNIPKGEISFRQKDGIKIYDVDKGEVQNSKWGKIYKDKVCNACEEVLSGKISFYVADSYTAIRWLATCKTPNSETSQTRFRQLKCSVESLDS